MSNFCLVDLRLVRLESCDCWGCVRGSCSFWFGYRSLGISLILFVMMSSDDRNARIASFLILDIFHLMLNLCFSTSGWRSICRPRIAVSVFLCVRGGSLCLLRKGQSWLRVNAEIRFVVSLGVSMVACHPILYPRAVISTWMVCWSCSGVSVSTKQNSVPQRARCWLLY